MVLSPTLRIDITAIRSSKWSSCLFPSHESQAHTIHIQVPPYSHSPYSQPQHKNTLSNAFTHRWHYRVLDIPCHQNCILSSDKSSLLGVLPQAHSYHNHSNHLISNAHILVKEPIVRVVGRSGVAMDVCIHIHNVHHSTILRK